MCERVSAARPVVGVHGRTPVPLPRYSADASCDILEHMQLVILKIGNSVAAFFECCVTDRADGRGPIFPPMT